MGLCPSKDAWHNPGYFSLNKRGKGSWERRLKELVVQYRKRKRDQTGKVMLSYFSWTEMMMEGGFFSCLVSLVDWFVDIHFSVPLGGKKTVARNVGLTGIRIRIWIWDLFWLSVLHALCLQFSLILIQSKSIESI